MTRVQFVIGVGRIRLFPSCLASLAWLGGIALGLWLAFDQIPDNAFPFIPIYQDRFIWTAIFARLSGPILEAVFCAPVSFAAFINGGFLRLDDEGLSPEKLAAFRWYYGLGLKARYLTRVLEWALVLFFASRVHHHWGPPKATTVYLAYAAVLAAVGLVSLGLHVYVTSKVYRWLERRIDRSVGAEQLELLREQGKRIAVGGAG